MTSRTPATSIFFIADTATGESHVGSTFWLDDLSFSGTVGIADNQPAPVPAGYVLFQNFPNPFNPSTTISFNLPEPSNVTLVIYNSIGQEVSRPINHEILGTGNHSVNWSAQDLPSGIYFYHLISEAGMLNRRMILMK